MDWFIAVLFAVSSAVVTGGVVYLNTRQVSAPSPHQRTYAGKWQLPPPGINLNLYTRTKELLDTLEQERNEALRAVTRTEAERDQAIEECKLLVAKLISARNIVRQYTHPKMEIFVKSRRSDSKIVTIL